jgi:hypothetical protein
MRALMDLTSSLTVPKRAARLTLLGLVISGFGDASGLGFGSTFLVDEEFIRFRHGT